MEVKENSGWRVICWREVSFFPGYGVPLTKCATVRAIIAIETTV